MPFRKKRSDTEIGNIPGMPKDVLDKYRDDAHLDTTLDKENVTTLHDLKKKYSGNNKNC